MNTRPELENIVNRSGLYYTIPATEGILWVTMTALTVVLLVKMKKETEFQNMLMDIRAKNGSI
ncbi:MAG: hypothetical protein K5879_06690 [Lachnospiraceae bacterium]|nr:hypothetical protein [Lachnospiraceae bacterium]